MMKRLLTSILLLALVFPVFAQEPTDYLSKEFHAGRREALRAIMPDNSVMAVFAYPTRNFSNDVDYLFHQNPDLYYFTGYKEPDGVLFIFKEAQTDASGTYKELLFLQKRNAQQESWTGRRLGVEGAKQKLGIAASFNGEDFKNHPVDLSKFKQVIYSYPPGLIPAKAENPSLAGLAATFQKKANIAAETPSNVMMETRRAYMNLTGLLREVKTPEEIVLLRKAIEISCQGQNEVMKAAHANMSELEIQGLHEFVHKKYGAEHVGYGSIIGSGENGCILHYETNTKTKVGNTLILMDVGAEYHGYTADVTRTIPANGKFTEDQRTIYQLVYDAQEAAFKQLKEGVPYNNASVAASDVIAEGLLKLGIIKDKKDVRKYYTHGLGHHIGLDVHDRSASRTLKANMVMTIEPGIYIPANSDCDKRWWDIAVRIEDDVLITPTGYEMLSTFAPRGVKEIEKLMAAKSALDDFKLPPLKSGN